MHMAMHTERSSDRFDRPQHARDIGLGGLAPGRVFSTVIGGCAMVATAYWLGARWVGDSFAGVPTGMWLVAAAGLAAKFWPAATQARVYARADEEASEENQAVTNDVEETASEAQAAPVAAGPTTLRIAREPMQTYTTPAKLPRFRSRWRSGIDASVRSAAATVAKVVLKQNEDSGVARTISTFLDRSDTAVRPLRIGLMLDDRTAKPFRDSNVRDTEWMLVEEDIDPAQACELHDLDAAVTIDSNGELGVRTRESDGRDASWFDWTGDRPLSYSALFPSRVDAARTTIGKFGANELRGDAGELARAVVRTAAILSRLPHRLTPADRLRGRKPTAAEGTDALRSAERFDIASAVLLDLARELELCGLAGVPATLAAARASGAWLATFQGPIDEHERARLMEVCGSAAGQHADVMLRLGAVRLATFRDSLAIDALLRADRMLRDKGTLPGVDHLKVIQSELSFGNADGMTLGRVAAGITLACATSPADRVAFIKEDLLEDMRYSGWLVGKDQDRASLIELLRSLEQARRAETYSLPAAA